jgi:hypothetical protein
MFGPRARRLQLSSSHPAKTLIAVAAVCAALGLTACTGGSKHAASQSVSAGQSTSSKSSTASVTPSPAPKTLPKVTAPISAPNGGSIKSTVASETVHTNAPIPVTATANFGTGVTAHVVSNTKITFAAKLPGEISGPAAQVTIAFVNSSSAPVSLANVVVNDSDAKGTPFVAGGSSPASPVNGTLDPGKTATGVYVFELTPGYVAPLTISVSYSTAAPVVLFVGDVK